MLPGGGGGTLGLAPVRRGACRVIKALVVGRVGEDYEEAQVRVAWGRGAPELASARER